MDAAHGRDERPVVTEWAPKSMSRETTFERDLHPRRDRETLSQILLKLCQRVSEDLMRQRYLGKTVGIKLRYADFHTLTRDTTLEAPMADAETIRGAARACLKRVPLDRRLRLLGVRVASLVRKRPIRTRRTLFPSVTTTRPGRACCFLIEKRPAPR